MRRRIAAHEEAKRVYDAAVAEPKYKNLDGFVMLEASGVEFPDEAARADLQEENLGAVTGEDLAFFTNLSYLDVGDNRLTLESLQTLPALQELHIHCNTI